MITRWASKPGREIDRNSQRCITRFNREEAGLKVTGHTTSHFDLYGDLDAMSWQTLATFNGETVYEAGGGGTKIFIPGDWMNILTADAVPQEVTQAKPVDTKEVMQQVRHWVSGYGYRYEEFSYYRSIFLERDEQGLKVVDRSDIYDEIVGTYTKATFRGIVVFEQAGLIVKTFIPGDWTKIVATP